MRWITIKEEKNIAGLIIQTVKCSNCGCRETIHQGRALPRSCYACGEKEEKE